MSYLGLRPHVVALFAVGLILLSLILLASGTLAPLRAMVGDALLGMVALVNWHRHVKARREGKAKGGSVSPYVARAACRWYRHRRG
jgi:hypothetical protein